MTHEMELIFAIADRALPIYESFGEKKLALVMDLDYVHEVCPLDLDGLLQAAPLDFTHDIAGIYRHFDRGTKRLQDCFVPRYAARNLS